MTQMSKVTGEFSLRKGGSGNIPSSLSTRKPKKVEIEKTEAEKAEVEKSETETETETEMTASEWVVGYKPIEANAESEIRSSEQIVEGMSVRSLIEEVKSVVLGVEPMGPR